MKVTVTFHFYPPSELEHSTDYWALFWKGAFWALKMWDNMSFLNPGRTIVEVEGE